MGMKRYIDADKTDVLLTRVVVKICYPILKKKRLSFLMTLRKQQAFIHCNKSLKNKLDRFCSEEKEFTIIREDEYSKTYLIPKKCVKIFKPRKLTEEEHEKRSLIAKEMFKNRHAAVKDNG